jgi:hypothetical protein
LVAIDLYLLNCEAIPAYIAVTPGNEVIVAARRGGAQNPILRIGFAIVLSQVACNALVAHASSLDTSLGITAIRNLFAPNELEWVSRRRLECQLARRY